MFWECLTCREFGVSEDAMGMLEDHASASPNCPVAGGVCHLDTGGGVVEISASDREWARA